jgi:alpha-mannosidase
VVTTEVTLQAGERRIEVTTRFENQVKDHRLRAVLSAPLQAERLDVEHGMAVVARPLDAGALGAGSERPAPTGQHHLFVDVSDGKAGVALMSRGLPEHEAMRAPGGGRSTQLALTLLRSVGWLSRGDLKVIDHAAGPMVPTPGAQELGPHVAEYAILLHAGDWQEGGVHAEARRYAAPAVPVRPRGKHTVSGRPLVQVEGERVALTALHPAKTGRGTIVRLLNASGQPTEAALRSSIRLSEAIEVSPLEHPIEPSRARVERSGDTVRFQLGPWQLATLLLR